MNKIVRSVLKNGQKEINIDKFTEQKYIDKERSVIVDGVKFKIKLTAEAYYKIYRKVQENET